jgi:hypothetical protein
MRQELAHAVALLDGRQQSRMQFEGVLLLQFVGDQILSVELPPLLLRCPW